MEEVRLQSKTIFNSCAVRASLVVGWERADTDVDERETRREREPGVWQYARSALAESFYHCCY